MSGINVYANGFVSISVCAPKEMSKEEIEHLANVESPTGISSAWRISEDTTFKGGEHMPCICEHDVLASIGYSIVKTQITQSVGV